MRYHRCAHTFSAICIAATDMFLASGTLQSYFGMILVNPPIICRTGGRMVFFENCIKIILSCKKVRQFRTSAFALMEAILRQTANHPVTLQAAPRPKHARLYFFHFRSNEMYSRDDEGAAFTSLSEAYDEALSSTREMIAQKLLTYAPIPWETVIEIEDEDGVLLDAVTFREAAGLA